MNVIWYLSIITLDSVKYSTVIIVIELIDFLSWNEFFYVLRFNNINKIEFLSLVLFRFKNDIKFSRVWHLYYIFFYFYNKIDSSWCSCFGNHYKRFTNYFFLFLKQIILRQSDNKTDDYFIRFFHWMTYKVTINV